MGLCLVTIQTAFRNNSTKNYDNYIYVKRFVLRILRSELTTSVRVLCNQFQSSQRNNTPHPWKLISYKGI